MKLLKYFVPIVLLFLIEKSFACSDVFKTPELILKLARDLMSSDPLGLKRNDTNSETRNVSDVHQTEVIVGSNEITFRRNGSLTLSSTSTKSDANKQVPLFIDTNQQIPQGSTNTDAVVVASVQGQGYTGQGGASIQANVKTDAIATAEVSNSDLDDYENQNIDELSSSESVAQSSSDAITFVASSSNIANEPSSAKSLAESSVHRTGSGSAFSNTFAKVNARDIVYGQLMP